MIVLPTITFIVANLFSLFLCNRFVFGGKSVAKLPVAEKVSANREKKKHNQIGGKTKERERKKERNQENGVRVVKVLLFRLSHCFGHKAHIRDQRWMPYLFAHQIIDNFTFYGEMFAEWEKSKEKENEKNKEEQKETTLQTVFWCVTYTPW